MKQSRSLATLSLIVCSLTLSAYAQQKTQKGSKTQSPLVEYSSSTSSSNLPFSDVVRVGDTLYLAGKLGTDSSGRLAQGGIAAETKQVMENIKATLEKNGSSLDHVVKCTVMLADIKEWAQMNTVYVTYFKKDRLPARSAFGTNGLALGARVEIECIAVVK
jgi:reactive intermediate/imine deaminase